MPDRRSDSGRRRSSPSPDRKRSRRSRSHSPRRRSPHRRSPRRRSSSPRRRSSHTRSSRRSRSRSPRRHSDRRRSRSRDRRSSPKRSPRKSPARSPPRRSSPRRSPPRRRSPSPRRLPDSNRSSDRSPLREPSPRKQSSASSPPRGPPLQSYDRRSRSHSPIRRDYQTYQSSHRDRPEVREAESSTHGPVRSSYRDERPSRRSPRRSPPRGRSRSPIQRPHSRERDRHERPESHRDPSPPPRRDSFKEKDSSKKTKFGSEDLVLREDISKHTKRKRLMLCDRFTDSDDEHFEAPENITIGIERSIRGNSPAIIRKEIKPEAVEMPRKKEEGTKPLHKREEFRTREEIIEKRVIKVIEDPNRRSHRSPPPMSDRWRDPNAESSLRGRDREGLQVVRRDDSFRNRELEERYGFREESREEVADSRVIRDTGSRYEDLRDRVSRPDVDQRYEADPRDLRHNLARRRSESDREPRPREARRDEARGDIRSRLGPRDRDGRGDRDRRDRDSRDSRGDRERERRKPDGPTLPDFKDRPEKGTFAEWIANPQAIPQSGKYYEHDNRSEMRDLYFDRRGRGRGRGGYRGGYRGSSFRGSYRGRGAREYVYNPREMFGSSEGEWLHDKFAEMEAEVDDDADNNPTSTTEK